jgi:1-acyl-sn-glycerol-3-phosphate acyltransferase
MPTLFDPKSYKPHNTLRYRLSARYFFGTWFGIRNRLEVHGRENVPKDRSFIAVANHLSNWDPPLISHAVDEPMAYLAKIELFQQHWFVRWLILAYGAISIDREKPEPSTFKAVKEMFKAGWNLGMFIEGTRNKNPGVLGQPHLGPAYFAKSNKVPLLPVGIIGTQDKNGKWIVNIGKPIEYSTDLEAVTWKLMEEIAPLCNQTVPPRPQPAAND